MTPMNEVLDAKATAQAFSGHCRLLSFATGGHRAEGLLPDMLSELDALAAQLA